MVTKIAAIISENTFSHKANASFKTELNCLKISFREIFIMLQHKNPFGLAFAFLEIYHLVFSLLMISLWLRIAVRLPNEAACII